MLAITSILTYSDLLKSCKFRCSHLCPQMLSAVNLSKHLDPDQALQNVEPDLDPSDSIPERIF